MVFVLPFLSTFSPSSPLTGAFLLYLPPESFCHGLCQPLGRSLTELHSERLPCSNRKCGVTNIFSVGKSDSKSLISGARNSLIIHQSCALSAGAIRASRAPAIQSWFPVLSCTADLCPLTGASGTIANALTVEGQETVRT